MLLADSLVVLGLATVSLGTIQETDGVKSRTFWLRNAGKTTTVIQQGYTSCGCTTIHFTKGKTLMPGDTAAVTLRFNTRGKGGEFEETGTVVYGKDKKKRLNLSMVGTCITSEETLMKQFPIRISDDLRLSVNRFDLGYMSIGETKERHVGVLHRNEKNATPHSDQRSENATPHSDQRSENRKESIPIKFTVDARTPKGLQHIPYKIETKVKGKKQVLTITLDVIIK